MQGRIQDLIRGGGPQIVTGLKLPFWGLSFVEFWCWGLIFGGQGGGPGPRGPPLDPPLTCVFYTQTYTASSVTDRIQLSITSMVLYNQFLMLHFMHDMCDMTQLCSILFFLLIYNYFSRCTDVPLGISNIFKRPMVMDSLNLNLSQISCRIADFNGFVDLQILVDFRI